MNAINIIHTLSVYYVYCVCTILREKEHDIFKMYVARMIPFSLDEKTML